jgi:hypothetical protein
MVVEGLSHFAAKELSRLVGNAFTTGSNAKKDTIFQPHEMDSELFAHGQASVLVDQDVEAVNADHDGYNAVLAVEQPPRALSEAAHVCRGGAEAAGACGKAEGAACGDGLAADEQAIADWSVAEVLTPPLDQRMSSSTECEVGENVTYWSDTHNQWMEACVKALNHDARGTLLSYDLDVKRGAQASKIRRQTVEQAQPQQSRAPPQQEKQTQQSQDVNQQCAQLPKDLNELPPFDVGDQVEYWSDTYSQWMGATVNGARECGAIYDLDVKRGASRRKMRAATWAPVPKPGAFPENIRQENADDHGADAAAGMAGRSTFLSADWSAEAAEDCPSHIVDASPSAAKAAQHVTRLFHQAEQGGGVPSVAILAHEQGGGIIGAARNVGMAGAGLVKEPSGVLGSAIVRQPGPLGGASVAGIAPGSIGGVAPGNSAPRVKQDGAPLQLPIIGYSHDGAPHAGGVGHQHACGSALPAGSIGHQLVCRAAPGGTPTSAAGGNTPMGGGSATVAGGSVVSGFGALTPAASSAGGARSDNLQGARAMNGHPPQPPSAGVSAPYQRQTANGVSVVVKAQPDSSALAGAPRPAVFTGAGMDSRRQETIRVGHGSNAVAAPPGAPLTAIAGQPQRPAGNAMASNGSRNRTLEVDELDMPSQLFNPQDPSVFSQLSNKLGLGSRAKVEEMQGFKGGLNDGVWYITDPDRAPSGPSKPGTGNAACGSEQLVLKLVRCHRIASNVLTETENFLRLQREYPSIVDDPHLAFPCKIFSCMLNGQKQKDLIVMRKVRGERLAEQIARKWYGNQVPRLFQIFERLGTVLGEFHSRYNSSQHGDLQPSNIFYDEAIDQIAFVDNGGIGVPTTETDIQHFSKSLKLLSDAYGARLATEGLQHFERGHALAKRTPVKR